MKSRSKDVKGPTEISLKIDLHFDYIDGTIVADDASVGWDTNFGSDAGSILHGG